MAWNPSYEIAVLRDAAKKLNAPVAVLVLRRRDGKIQTLSFGETVALCEGEAKDLGNHLHESALRFGMAEEMIAQFFTSSPTERNKGQK